LYFVLRENLTPGPAEVMTPAARPIRSGYAGSQRPCSRDESRRGSRGFARCPAPAGAEECGRGGVAPQRTALSSELRRIVAARSADAAQVGGLLRRRAV